MEDSTAAWASASVPLVIVISESHAGQTQHGVTPGASRFIPGALTVRKTAVTTGMADPPPRDKTAAQDGFFKVESSMLVAD
ncbi:hypothetical protein [Mycobacterium sp.]|uniref:hypothetical protein n=1 Tax=Mycobacterium sp. TaxID=1785 RepID=UPI0031CFC08D